MTQNRKSIRLVWFALTGILVVWALRQVSFAEMWLTLASIQLPMLALLLAVNSGVIWLFSSRWWVILRALNYRPPYRHLIAYRLTAFGISYFTPGTQFGGEPAQIFLLSRRDNIPSGDAIVSVAVDKLFEMAFNFAFLGVGLFITLQTGIFAVKTPIAAPVMALSLIVLPLLLPVLLCSGKFPRIPLPSRAVKSSVWQKIAAAIHIVPAKSAALCHNSPRQMLSAAVLSVAIWLALVAEYRLMVQALGLQLSFSETIVLLTAARLAFLFPTPGGLGTLEAGQVIAMEALGFDPALGLSLSLLIRARDVLFGLGGLWLGHRLNK